MIYVIKNIKKNSIAKSFVINKILLVLFCWAAGVIQKFNVVDYRSMVRSYGK